MAESNTPLYTPTPPTTTPDTEDGRRIADWVQRELHALSQALSSISRLQLTPVSKPPVTPRQGLVAVSDGVNWNPLGHATGSKQNLLVYRLAGVIPTPAWVQADIGPVLIDDDGLIQVQSTASNRPLIDMVNTTVDTLSAQQNYAKSRNNGNTLTGDLFAQFFYYGFANGNYQPAAAIQVQQANASSGNNVPSQIIFYTSDALGQLNHKMFFDNSGILNLPTGPIIIGGMIAVATPNNANAATAGVALDQLYRDTADPTKVYIRTA